MRTGRAARWVVGFLALGSALLVSATSVAFACTAIMGPLTMSPTSGPAGSTITTSAAGLKAKAKYALQYANTTSGDCMSFSDVTIIKKVTTDGAGNWSGVTATIPAHTTMGTHGVCAMEISPVKGMTGTTHDSFTIT